MKRDLVRKICGTIFILDKFADTMYCGYDIMSISSLFLRVRNLTRLKGLNEHIEVNLKDSYTIEQFYDILFTEYMPRIAKFLQKIIKLYAKCQKLDLNDIYIKNKYDKYANKYITPIVCGISSMTTTKKDK